MEKPTNIEKDFLPVRRYILINKGRGCRCCCYCCEGKFKDLDTEFVSYGYVKGKGVYICDACTEHLL